MDRGAWQATVHGVTRVGHDLATKPPPPYNSILLHSGLIPHPGETHSHFGGRQGSSVGAQEPSQKPWSLQDPTEGAAALKPCQPPGAAQPERAGQAWGFSPRTQPGRGEPFPPCLSSSCFSTSRYSDHSTQWSFPLTSPSLPLLLT